MQTPIEMPKRGSLLEAVDLAIGSGMKFSEFEKLAAKTFITETLVRHKGNQYRAALELGMHRNTMSRWIDVLTIDISGIVKTCRPHRQPVMSQRFKRLNRA